MSNAYRPAAIQGTYTELKMVKTRKVLQIVVEVPMEQAQQVTDLLGWPKADAERWVAIALLNFAQGDAPPLPGERGGAHPATTSAVMQLKDASFRRWLCRVAVDGQDFGEEAAIKELYVELNITSRKELAHNEAARNAWYALLDDYNREKDNG